MSKWGSTISVDVDIDEFDDDAVLEEFLRRASKGRYNVEDLKKATEAIKVDIKDFLPAPIIKLDSIYATDIIEKIKETVRLKGEFFLYNSLEKIA